MRSAVDSHRTGRICGPPNDDDARSGAATPAPVADDRAQVTDRVSEHAGTDVAQMGGYHQPRQLPGQQLRSAWLGRCSNHNCIAVLTRSAAFRSAGAGVVGADLAAPAQQVRAQLLELFRVDLADQVLPFVGIVG